MHDRSGRAEYPPQAADIAGTSSVAMRGAGGHAGGAHRALEAGSRAEPEQLCPVAVACRGTLDFDRFSAWLPERSWPSARPTSPRERVARCRRHPPPVHRPPRTERRSMRLRALLGSLALALLMLGCSHVPPAALPGAVPCVSLTPVEECELANFTRIQPDHTAMR
jgi:hypothetical protein